MLSEDHSPSHYSYPEAERLDLVEEMHGYRVADPYRWLEDLGDPRTQEWCARQDELFTGWQERWLGHGERDRLRGRLSALAGIRPHPSPLAPSVFR